VQDHIPDVHRHCHVVIGGMAFGSEHGTPVVTIVHVLPLQLPEGRAEGST
jgi:hypothetical protein